MGCIPGCWGSWLTPFQRLFSHLWKVTESTGNPQQWEANTAPICQKGDLRNPGLLSSTALLGKITEQALLECVFGYMKEKWGTGKSQHGFANAKSCLTSLFAFCDRFANRESWTITKQKFTVCYVKDKVGIYFSAWSYILSLLPPFWGKRLLKLGIHKLLGIS